MDLYNNPLVTEDKMYLIDKVVRMRGQNGRFGVDHSEILNYELELANKARDEHMNHLVYKGEDGENEATGKGESTEVIKYPGEMSTSEVLFKRLSKKGTISSGSKISLLES
jgi:hypothetical protein